MTTSLNTAPTRLFLLVAWLCSCNGEAVIDHGQEESSLSENSREEDSRADVKRVPILDVVNGLRERGLPLCFEHAVVTSAGLDLQLHGMDAGVELPATWSEVDAWMAKLPERLPGYHASWMASQRKWIVCPVQGGRLEWSVSLQPGVRPAADILSELPLEQHRIQVFDRTGGAILGFDAAIPEGEAALSVREALTLLVAPQEGLYWTLAGKGDKGVLTIGLASPGPLSPPAEEKDS